MPRRYRRRINNRDKYSIENSVYNTPTSWVTVPGDEAQDLRTSVQTSNVLVPASTTEGMRKVKHLTLSFSATTDYPVLYALVYCPQGYVPNPIRYPEEGTVANLYEPNQFVMASGVLDFSGGPLRIRTPLSRNLNSGDYIALILASTQSSSVLVNCKYAITLQ